LISDLKHLINDSAKFRGTSGTASNKVIGMQCSESLRNSSSMEGEELCSTVKNPSSFYTAYSLSETERNSPGYIKATEFLLQWQKSHSNGIGVVYMPSYIEPYAPPPLRYKRKVKSNSNSGEQILKE
jgi:hypothetical protein